MSVQRHGLWHPYSRGLCLARAARSPSTVQRLGFAGAGGLGMLAARDRLLGASRSGVTEAQTPNQSLWDGLLLALRVSSCGCCDFRLFLPLQDSCIAKRSQSMVSLSRTRDPVLAKGLKATLLRLCADWAGQIRMKTSTCIPRTIKVSLQLHYHILVPGTTV